MHFFIHLKATKALFERIEGVSQIIECLFSLAFNSVKYVCTSANKANVKVERVHLLAKFADTVRDYLLKEESALIDVGEFDNLWVKTLHNFVDKWCQTATLVPFKIFMLQNIN